VQESVRAPDFSGLGVVAVSSPPPSRCGNVGTRVWCWFPSSVGGATIFGQDSAIGPTERHFHSELGILPILVRMLSLAAAQGQNVRFQKPAQNEHFYRLSCRAERFLLGGTCDKVLTVFNSYAEPTSDVMQKRAAQGFGRPNLCSTETWRQLTFLLAWLESLRIAIVRLASSPTYRSSAH
jgi:hypothetical protein